MDLLYLDVLLQTDSDFLDGWGGCGGGVVRRPLFQEVLQMLPMFSSGRDICIWM